MTRDNHIVLTTIFVPDLLGELLSNLTRHGQLEATTVWVVGDRKTPAATPELCAKLRDSGLDVRYLDIAEQDRWGAHFPAFYGRIPYNNETRRNLGYLRALEDGCQRLISIDDDNWPTEDDFVGGHCGTGMSWAGPFLSEPTGYHNVCEHLSFDVKRPIYP